MSSRKHIVVVITLVIFSGVMTVSCGNKSSPAPAVSFSKDVIPIFTTSCAINSSCHLGANSTNLGVSLDSTDAYNSIMAKELVKTSNPSASLLYVEINSGLMPKPPSAPLSASQQNTILNWIEQGAKNN